MKITDNNLDVEIRTEVCNTKFDEFGTLSQDTFKEVIFYFYKTSVEIKAAYDELEAWVIKNIDECNKSTSNKSACIHDPAETPYVPPSIFIEDLDHNQDLALYVLNGFLKSLVCK